VPLYAGDVFNTKRGGSVVFELKLRHTTCTLNAGSVLAVRPAKLVVSKMTVGQYWCMIARSNSDERFEAAGVKVHAKDPVFGVRVDRTHAVVVKVDRGFVVVTGSGGPDAAVVVGQKQQVVVPAKADPLPPTPIQLSQKDNSA